METNTHKKSEDAMEQCLEFSEVCLTCKDRKTCVSSIDKLVDHPVNECSKLEAIKCHSCGETFEVEYEKTNFGMDCSPVWMANSDDAQCPGCDSWMVSPH